MLGIGTHVHTLCIQVSQEVLNGAVCRVLCSDQPSQVRRVCVHCVYCATHLYVVTVDMYCLALFSVLYSIALFTYIRSLIIECRLCIYNAGLSDPDYNQNS